jgi:hypothetical protein
MEDLDIKKFAFRVDKEPQDRDQEGNSGDFRRAVSK